MIAESPHSPNDLNAPTNRYVLLTHQRTIAVLIEALPFAFFSCPRPQGPLADRHLKQFNTVAHKTYMACYQEMYRTA